MPTDNAVGLPATNFDKLKLRRRFSLATPEVILSAERPLVCIVERQRNKAFQQAGTERCRFQQSAEWEWAAAGSAAAGAEATGFDAPGSLEGTFLQGTVPASLESLSDVAENFGDISLLFTLLILALLDKSDEEGGGGGVAGALGFLAGLSLASQLGQSFGGNQSGQSIAATGGAGGVGGQLDLSA